MIKGLIQEKDITIVNIYAPNIGACRYIRQTLTGIRGEIDTNSRELWHPTYTNGQIIKTENKETQTLNETLDQMHLIDIFRTFHLNAEEYTFYSSAYGTFSRIDHILGHRSSFSKFKKIEIISGIFSDHNTVRLDINYRKKSNNNNSKKQKLMEIKWYIIK